MRRVDDDNQRVDCSALPELNLYPWKQNTHRVKIDDDKPGKVWIIKSSGPKKPNVIKIGGSVTTGSVTIGGSTLWAGELPLRIPTKPFDAISAKVETPDVPYPPVFGHGILWSGKASLSSGKVQLSGDISFPQFVRNAVSPFSVNWYNGLFTLEISTAWNTSFLDNLSLEGDYSTPVYFHDSFRLRYLRNESKSEVTPSSTPSNTPTVSKNHNTAPLILLGTYADFGKTFLWNGNVTLIIPQPKINEDTVDLNLKKLAYTPKTYTKHVKIGGKVTRASASAEGYSLWSGNLPLAIPVAPFDRVAGPEDVPTDELTYYGNGVNWQGSLVSTTTKTGSVSASFSLPKFVHSNGITPFTIQWYNGELSVDFEVSWWSTCDGALDFEGTYTSQVYFSERKQYWYLKNSSYDISLIGKDTGYSGSPKQFTKGLKAPLILLGTYSNDGKMFLWSGNFTVVLPQVVSIPYTLLQKTAASPSNKKRVPLRLVGGQINVEGWNVWYNTLPVTIPTKPFDAVASSDGNDEPYDRPTIFGHGILWNGSTTIIDNSYVKIRGTYSFPQFVHSNGKTNNVSLTWLNGNFDLQFQTNTSFQVSGTYTTPVFLAERPTFEAINEISTERFTDLSGLGITKTTVPRVLNGDPENYLTAPLILFGIYSRDAGRSEFLWSGQSVLMVPENYPNQLLLKESSPESASQAKLGGVVKSVEITINGTKVTGVSNPPFTIPTSILSAVSTSWSKEGEPAGYANGVLWSGHLNTSSTRITGFFSLPTSETGTNNAWYNGNFTFDYEIIWTTTNSSFDGPFSSPIYYQENSETSNKKADNQLSLAYSSSATPTVNPGVVDSSPIILKGIYSTDKTVFHWSGEFTIILPPKLKGEPEPPVEPENRQVIKAFVNGGSVTSGGSAIWLGNRVPLSLPVQPFDFAVSSLDSRTAYLPKNVHGIPWQGYISSDAANTIKIWGAYSFPRYLHSNGSGTPLVKLEWFNGDFAFDLKLLFGITADIHLNGTYKTFVQFEERSSHDGLTPEWSLDGNGSSPSETPIVSPSDVTSYAPVILHGVYSKDRKTFVWSGNATIIIYN